MRRKMSTPPETRPEPHVVRDHHEDREGAKALDFGAVACFCGSPENLHPPVAG